MLDGGARVFGYRFDGYWQDVGTVESYWQPQMELLDDHPPLDLYDRDWVIHTRSEERAPARIGPTANVHRSLITHGCLISGTVEHSVLSPGVRVDPGAIVRDSVIMFDSPHPRGAVVDRAILDKEVSVGPNAIIGTGNDFDTPNRQEPTRLNTGITLVGKKRHHPGRRAHRPQRAHRRGRAAVGLHDQDHQERGQRGARRQQPARRGSARAARPRLREPATAAARGDRSGTPVTAVDAATVDGWLAALGLAADRAGGARRHHQLGPAARRPPPPRHPGHPHPRPGPGAAVLGPLRAAHQRLVPRSYRKLLRWNDELPFVKFACRPDERPCSPRSCPRAPGPRCARAGAWRGWSRSATCCWTIRSSGSIRAPSGRRCPSARPGTRHCWRATRTGSGSSSRRCPHEPEEPEGLRRRRDRVRYAVVLRAINVGRHNRIRMDVLRAALEDTGHHACSELSPDRQPDVRYGP